MSVVCLIDTSIFLELLNVPGKSNRPKKIRALFRERHQDGWNFALPIASLIETGNHIAQNGDGRQRRSVAEQFVVAVRASLDDEAPWNVVAPPDEDTIRGWLDVFPDHAGAEIGLGDVSIIHEWERQRELNPNSDVWIWSLDSDLAAYGPPD